MLTSSLRDASYAYNPPIPKKRKTKRDLTTKPTRSSLITICLEYVSPEKLTCPQDKSSDLSIYKKILGSIFKRASLFVASPTSNLEENPTMAMLFFCLNLLQFSFKRFKQPF